MPRRALADGVVERRRAPRRRNEPALTTETASVAPPARGESIPQLLTPEEHYRMEMERRGGRFTGDLASLLAEAKAEYEAMLAAPRPAGKGGRPKKRAAPKKEFDLEDFGDEGTDEE